MICAKEKRKAGKKLRSMYVWGGIANLEAVEREGFLEFVTVKNYKGKWIVRTYGKREFQREQTFIHSLWSNDYVLGSVLEHSDTVIKKTNF